ncbi:putative protein OS=Tsukamurella paurometabola (strain ATCC 8368 / DSM / CCUG 35730 /CIP 100753 / JCM 10117 / KCTC 9821 / NBRC 16120 / NCIMB 702349/ NCTC 13040) OX=521096 GN=Tpau_1085 PE=4 SV=1 [Tsukamurella paurometabola]|uniref:Uncharacterized protein n=1 Tax=Tsukamurella paurometabola (strain ATCC 8368 / DSM 20162 / CCUG 35730 / CIP 100753 / JCM 10117 / KCTC 9821 / NBRC 16120 / NCIMB 702349 / NCTC 13040) TaxID=521096 RepID=D5UVC7_TSUPD|nr:hypothetical protein [Tsukamurella paurometabola]ADG77717.1 conserved hypothetical protein [Tsukamurella paurometabola DSM 20162]SUP28456.1 Uncharacterised protein [Tsukamurella paurometabola]
MTVRVYVPSTLAGLQVLQRDGELFPLGGTVFGVTPALREAYTAGDEEELAEAAMRHAARASLRLLAVDDEDAPAAAPDGADPDPVRRVVITVDVPAAKERPDLDDAVLKVSEPIRLKDVLAVHVDVSEAEPAVTRAAQVVDAADLGDEDAELAVGDAEDHDLAWYATQELPFLLELL